MHASLQRKFSFSYIAIILAVLILLNTYPLITSENLTFRSKQSSLQGSVSVMVTALSGLEELSEENVAGAMTLVEETGISRVLVTDASGRVLYDTRETDGAIGRYAFYTELVQALRGEDVFYTEFSDKAFKSRAASPVIYHSQTIGAVYAYEYDTEQAELLLSLQRNLLTISAVVLVFAGGISVLLSRVLTRRFGVLADAIRKMREGSYSHRAEVGGHDEISELAAEFNDMADRLQTTEDARRRFVSDASHELKTPLAGIRLLSDSILQTENMDAQTVREFVGDIEQESERLARITENLLRLTRLDSGMLPEAQRAGAARRLVDNVNRYGHITTGFLGTPYICEVLTRFGYEDVAYELLLNKKIPSWLYPISMGATTIWERWNSMLPNGMVNSNSMVSFNHYAYGAIGDWLYRWAAGLQEAAPGFREIRIKPYLNDHFTSMKAEQRTPYGLASSGWTKEGDALTLTVEIPANTTAEVYVPSAAADKVTESGRALDGRSDLKVAGWDDGYTLVRLGSGRYEFRSTLK